VRRTSITQERFFERLEKELPGSPAPLMQFLDQVAALDVFAEYGAESMILRWRPTSGIDWNVGTISKRGQLWLDNMGAQTNGVGLLALHKRYLKKLATLAPDAHVRQTPKETGWYVTQNDREAITVDRVLSASGGIKGWTEAISEFQKAVTENSFDD
jgi:predicted flavoprotein YhiN